MKSCGHQWFYPECTECVSAVMASRSPEGTPIFSIPITAEVQVEREKRLGIARYKCIHMGDRIPLGPGCGCGTAPAYVCAIYGKCGMFDGGSAKLKTCLGCEDRTLRHEAKPEPSTGVVIGTYGYPNLIELQIKLIRKHCGEVPILITDDCSDGTAMTPWADSSFGKLSALSRKYSKVTLWSNPIRLGHAGGDLTSYFVGLQWAKALGLDILAKLSQRCLLDVPEWLQEGSKALWESGESTSSQKCLEGRSVFAIRSEAMLMVVDKWATADALDHLRPRPLSIVEGTWGVPAETVIWDTIRDRLCGRIHRWKLFGEDRMTKYDGMIWHCSHGKEDYQAMFDREGVEMDKNFTCKGWVQLADYKG